jgi:hypothetical protein
MRVKVIIDLGKRFKIRFSARSATSRGKVKNTDSLPDLIAARGTSD